MNQIPGSEQKNITLRARIESRIKHWINRTRSLNGEPRYVAMGMAIGIFVSATPTIPFQTLIAVALSFIMRGSKAAAAVGVWLSNPITFPIFYLASYKTGTFLFGMTGLENMAGQTTADLVKSGIHITVAAILGGILIGIILAVGAYFITHRIVTKIRSRERRSRALLRRRRKKEKPTSPKGRVETPREQRTAKRK
ncbi:MAG: DUF2062 domain-containing protein [Desulfobacterales bacterium]